jgi:hypothetical protein
MNSCPLCQTTGFFWGSSCPSSIASIRASDWQIAVIRANGNPPFESRPINAFGRHSTLSRRPCDMAERSHYTTSCEKEILERASRRYFTLPTGTPERAAWIQKRRPFSPVADSTGLAGWFASGSTTTAAGSTHPHQNPALEALSR